MNRLWTTQVPTSEQQVHPSPGDVATRLPRHTELKKQRSGSSGTQREKNVNTQRHRRMLATRTPSVSNTHDARDQVCHSPRFTNLQTTDRSLTCSCNREHTQEVCATCALCSIPERSGPDTQDKQQHRHRRECQRHAPISPNQTGPTHFPHRNPLRVFHLCVRTVRAWLQMTDRALTCSGNREHRHTRRARSTRDVRFPNGVVLTHRTSNIIDIDVNASVMRRSHRTEPPHLTSLTEIHCIFPLSNLFAIRLKHTSGFKTVRTVHAEPRMADTTPACSGDLLQGVSRLVLFGTSRGHCYRVTLLCVAFE